MNISQLKNSVARTAVIAAGVAVLATIPVAAASASTPASQHVQAHSATGTVSAQAKPAVAQYFW
jgi:hypothetical protein